MALRIIKPVENVEYTFRFPPKKQFTYRWYGEVTDSGRYIMHNQTTNFYTDITPQYFSTLVKNRLVKKTTVAPAEEKPIEERKKEQPPAEPKTGKTPEDEKRVNENQNEDSALDAESVAFVDKAIKWLENLRPEDKYYLNTKFSDQKELSVTKMITDLNYIKSNGISDKGFGIMVSRYVKLESTLSAFLSKLGGIK